MDASSIESRHFLLVDRDESMRALLTHFITLAGHQVVCSVATIEATTTALSQAADPDDELQIDYIIADSTPETQELMSIKNNLNPRVGTIAFSSHYLRGAEYQIRRPDWEGLKGLLEKLGQASASGLAS